MSGVQLEINEITLDMLDLEPMRFKLLFEMEERLTKPNTRRSNLVVFLLECLSGPGRVESKDCEATTDLDSAKFRGRKEQSLTIP